MSHQKIDQKYLLLYQILKAVSSLDKYQTKLLNIYLSNKHHSREVFSKLIIIGV
jgi:hypothetical protein